MADSGEVYVYHASIHDFSPKQQIIVMAVQQGINVRTALQVANCESGFNPLAKNPNSSASGTWQFIKSTWLMVSERSGTNYPLEDRFDNVKATEQAFWLVKNDGWHHWVCYTDYLALRE